MDRIIKEAFHDQASKVNFPKNLNIEELIREKKKRRFKLQWTLVPLLVIICFFCSWKITDTIAGLFETEQVEHLYHKYLIYDNYYYVLTEDVVEKKDIGNELGEVKRSGEWAYLDEGDSDIFIPGIKYYEIKGEKNKIVAQIKKDNRGPLEYQVLKKEKPIEEVDEKNIYGAKNDLKGVQKSIENVRQVVPFLYEITDEELKIDFVKLANDKKHYYVKLMYGPYTNNPKHPKIIFVRQYEKNYVNQYASDMSLDGDFWFDKKDRVNQFNINNMEWIEYRSKREKEYVSVFHAEKNNVIYEVSAQLYMAEEVEKFLETFQQRNAK
ncbi:hypothetical protein [Bacillus cereus]|uniref:DUF4367 domain-containing protein n=1 Tax=Bacillus cereus TaxID=1396 RepID=A0A2B9E4G2_BACCE|nr:hypothetical protein [Bacillus cereus]PGM94717.1 hypothetical protein CN958_11760 [Bacillus cereus]